MRTMAAPTQTPRTTHRRRPKMEVGLESWSFIAAAPVVLLFIPPTSEDKKRRVRKCTRRRRRRSSGSWHGGTRGERSMDAINCSDGLHVYLNEAEVNLVADQESGHKQNFQYQSLYQMACAGVNQIIISGKHVCVFLTQ